MNKLVRLITNDDGVTTDDTKWCLVDPAESQGSLKLCSGEFFGAGESIATYEEKTVSRGGISCDLCLRKIKMYKSVKL